MAPEAEAQAWEDLWDTFEFLRLLAVRPEEWEATNEFDTWAVISRDRKARRRSGLRRRALLRAARRKRKPSQRGPDLQPHHPHLKIA